MSGAVHYYLGDKGYTSKSLCMRFFATDVLTTDSTKEVTCKHCKRYFSEPKETKESEGA